MSAANAGKFAPKKQARAARARDTFPGMAPARISKLTLNIDPALHRELKTAAVVEGRTMREIVEECVTAYLRGGR